MPPVFYPCFCFKALVVGVLLAVFCPKALVADPLSDGLDKDDVVLVINSYHPGYSWSYGQLTGFLKPLDWFSAHNHMYVEYLDAKRTDWGNSYEPFVDYIQTKYRNKKIKALVAFDDHGYRCSIQIRSALGLKVPVFFSGINGAIDYEDPAQFDVTGVMEQISAYDSLVWALEAFPNVEKCYVVLEKSLTGSLMYDDLLSKSEAYLPHEVAFERVDNLPYSELEELTARLDDKALVLVLPYFRNMNGMIVDQGTIISTLAAKSEAPFVVAYRFSLSESVVGGKLLDGQELGERLSSMVIEYFSGKPIEAIPAVLKTPSQWTFSSPALKRFGLKKNQLPQGHILVFDDQNGVWKWVVGILILATFIFLQSLLIGILLKGRQRLKQLSTDLRASRNELSSWIIHAPLPITVVGQDGRIVAINEKFTELLGYDSSDIAQIDEMWSILIQDEEERSQFVSRWKSILESKKKTSVLPLEINVTSKSGKLEVLEIYMSEIGEFLVCHYLEITWRSKIERELQEALDQAHNASVAKTQFLANMSHEIRTPLNGVLGMAQLLAETRLSQEQKSFLETIKKSGEILLMTINDILDLSKIESGHIGVETIPVNLKNCIDDCVTVSLPKMDTDNVAFSVSIGEEVPQVILGDGYRISQVIINLLTNAFKYTKKGTVELVVSAEELEDNRFELRVGVKDTGIGVSPEKLESIFEPFNQADPSITRQYGGTGLGLTISRKLANRMGGDLVLSSTEGVGSEFVFSWIASAVGFVGSKNEDQENKGGPSKRLEHFKTLVVEDNSVNAKVVELSLGRLGITIDKAVNGQEALDLFETQHYDLVFMDIQMPVMDGLKATRVIREKRSKDQQPFIVALTAHALADHIAQCREAGMNAFLSKPFTFDQLSKTIDLYLNQASSDRSRVYF